MVLCFKSWCIELDKFERCFNLNPFSSIISVKVVVSC